MELEFIQCLANPNYIHCKQRFRLAFHPIPSGRNPVKNMIFPSQKHVFFCNFLNFARNESERFAFAVIAQRGYLKDPAFVNYLKYLTYWKEPEYARYIKYPLCLYFLDMLQYEHFRREMVTSQCVKFIDDQAVLLWQHYTRRRQQLQSAFNQSGDNALAGQNQAAGSADDAAQQPPNLIDSNGPSPSDLSNGHTEHNGSSSPTHDSGEPKRKHARIA